MTAADEPGAKNGNSRTTKLLTALSLGLAMGLVAGLGVVFHDGHTWREGLGVGLGFFSYSGSCSAISRSPGRSR